MIKSRDLVGKPLVTITHGEIIGKVKDVLIDPEKFEIAALVLQGGIFKRGTTIFPRSIVHVFGKDVILVKSNEAMRRDNELDHVASLIAVAGQMRGRPVATETGVRIGIVNDMVVDETGKVVGYDLARVFVKGSLAESKQIPLAATRSLGPDLVIVDTDLIESAQEDEQA
jgi:uncharacterized protein YrrD